MKKLSSLKKHKKNKAAYAAPEQMNPNDKSIFSFTQFVEADNDENGERIPNTEAEDDFGEDEEDLRMKASSSASTDGDISSRARTLVTSPEVENEVAAELLQNEWHAIQRPMGEINLAKFEPFYHEFEKHTRKKLDGGEFGSHCSSFLLSQPPKHIDLERVKVMTSKFLQKYLLPHERRPSSDSSFFSSTQFEFHTQNLTLAGGLEASLDMCAYVIFSPGDVVLCASPFSIRVLQAFEERCQVEVRPVPFNDLFNAKIEANNFQAAYEKAVSKKKVVRGVFLQNCCRSMGAHFVHDDVASVCEWAYRLNLWIIIDESLEDDAPFQIAPTKNNNIFRASKLFADSSPQMRQRIVCVWSLSEDLCLPGLQFSTIYAENARVQKALRHLNIVQPCAPLVQAYMLQILENLDDVNELLLSKRNQLKEKRDFVLGRLEQIGIPYVKPYSGNFVFIDLRSYIRNGDFHGEQKLWRKLWHSGVYLNPGSLLGASQTGWFQIGVTLEPAAMTKGFEILEKIVSAQKHLSKDEEMKKPKVTWDESQEDSEQNLQSENSHVNDADEKNKIEQSERVHNKEEMSESVAQAKSDNSKKKNEELRVDENKLEETSSVKSDEKKLSPNSAAFFDSKDSLSHQNSENLEPKYFFESEAHTQRNELILAGKAEKRALDDDSLLEIVFRPFDGELRSPSKSTKEGRKTPEEPPPQEGTLRQQNFVSSLPISSPTADANVRVEDAHIKKMGAENKQIFREEFSIDVIQRSRKSDENIGSNELNQEENLKNENFSKKCKPDLEAEEKRPNDDGLLDAVFRPFDAPLSSKTMEEKHDNNVAEKDEKIKDEILREVFAIFPPPANEPDELEEISFDQSFGSNDGAEEHSDEELSFQNYEELTRLQRRLLLASQIRWANEQAARRDYRPRQMSIISEKSDADGDAARNDGALLKRAENSNLKTNEALSGEKADERGASSHIDNFDSSLSSPTEMNERVDSDNSDDRLKLHEPEIEKINMRHIDINSSEKLISKTDNDAKNVIKNNVKNDIMNDDFKNDECNEPEKCLANDNNDEMAEEIVNDSWASENSDAILSQVFRSFIKTQSDPKQFDSAEKIQKETTLEPKSENERIEKACLDARMSHNSNDENVELMFKFEEQKAVLTVHAEKAYESVYITISANSFASNESHNNTTHAHDAQRDEWQSDTHENEEENFCAKDNFRENELLMLSPTDSGVPEESNFSRSNSTSSSVIIKDEQENFEKSRGTHFQIFLEESPDSAMNPHQFGDYYLGDDASLNGASSRNGRDNKEAINKFAENSYHGNRMPNSISSANDAEYKRSSLSIEFPLLVSNKTQQRSANQNQSAALINRLFLEEDDEDEKNVNSPSKKLNKSEEKENRRENGKRNKSSANNESTSRRQTKQAVSQRQNGSLIPDRPILNLYSVEEEQLAERFPSRESSTKIDATKNSNKNNEKISSKQNESRLFAMLRRPRKKKSSTETIRKSSSERRNDAGEAVGKSVRGAPKWEPLENIEPSENTVEDKEVKVGEDDLISKNNLSERIRFEDEGGVDEKDTKAEKVSTKSSQNRAEKNESKEIESEGEKLTNDESKKESMSAAIKIVKMYNTTVKTRPPQTDSFKELEKSNSFKQNANWDSQIPHVDKSDEDVDLLFKNSVEQHQLEAKKDILYLRESKRQKLTQNEDNYEEMGISLVNNRSSLVIGENPLKGAGAEVLEDVKFGAFDDELVPRYSCVIPLRDKDAYNSSTNVLKHSNINNSKSDEYHEKIAPKQKIIVESTSPIFIESTSPTIFRQLANGTSQVHHHMLMSCNGASSAPAQNVQQNGRQQLIDWDSNHLVLEHKNITEISCKNDTQPLNSELQMPAAVNRSDFFTKTSTRLNNISPGELFDKNNDVKKRIYEGEQPNNLHHSKSNYYVISRVESAESRLNRSENNEEAQLINKNNFANFHKSSKDETYNETKHATDSLSSVEYKEPEQLDSARPLEATQSKNNSSLRDFGVQTGKTSAELLCCRLRVHKMKRKSLAKLGGGKNIDRAGGEDDASSTPSTRVANAQHVHEHEFVVCRNPQHAARRDHCDPRRLYIVRQSTMPSKGRTLTNENESANIKNPLQQISVTNEFDPNTGNQSNSITVRHTPGSNWMVTSVCRTAPYRTNCDNEHLALTPTTPRLPA